MRVSRANTLPPPSSIRSLRIQLVRWFDMNGRIYPWRETRDPFRILIAEMMLRRTKADQVRSVYEKLFVEYTDINSFAQADEDKIRKILYPLGLKWRIPAFVRVAKQIQEKYRGVVPQTREELLTLPGVGDYVAGAVLSIAYGKREWIVDSNVVRLFRRYFGIETSKEGRRDKDIIQIAKAYVSNKNPRKANIAMLDFTALVCTPQRPKHERCPLKRGCQYLVTHHDLDSLADKGIDSSSI